MTLLKRILPLVLAFSLFAVLVPTQAGAADESFTYEREPSKTLLGSTQYLGQTESAIKTPGDFAITGVIVIKFILTISKKTAKEDFTNWIPTLPANGPYTYTKNLNASQTADLAWVVDHYSGGVAVTKAQMLKFGASLLAFFVGLDAKNKGKFVPAIDPGVPAASTTSTTTTTLDTTDPCNTTLPITNAACHLGAWKATWGSTIAFLDQQVRVMSNITTCTDIRTRASDMIHSAGVHSIATEITALRDAIDAFAPLDGDGKTPCTAGGNRSAMIAAVRALGVAVYGADFGWWLDNQVKIQRLENVIDAVLIHQYGCDALAAFALPAPPTASLASLNAAIAALGAEDDCGFDDGTVNSPASIAANGDAAGTALDALLAAARNGSSNYPVPDPAFNGIADELIAVRALAGEIDPSSTPPCEAIGFAFADMATAVSATANTNVANAQVAINAMQAACGTASATQTYIDQKPVVKANIDAALGWAVVV